MRKAARPTTKADETPEFIAFWEIWRPHMNVNDGRGDARDEFVYRVEKCGVDPMDMVDGARWFIRSGGNQTPSSDGIVRKMHAQTWLGKRAFEDGAEQERAFQAKQAERAENVVRMEPRPTGQTAFLRAYSKREA